MKVFLSWSGEQSREVAKVLKEWIPDIIQAVDPWMSEEDIHKGARWGSELADSLQGPHFGLLCLTRENLTAPWLLFEAGALSKSLDVARVCPFLFGIEKTDIERGPLLQF